MLYATKQDALRSPSELEKRADRSASDVSKPKNKGIKMKIMKKIEALTGQEMLGLHERLKIGLMELEEYLQFAMEKADIHLLNAEIKGFRSAIQVVNDHLGLD